MVVAEIVRRQTDVIVTEGSQATRAATEEKLLTIPIVMATTDNDPLGAGFVASLARPGGNVTGLSYPHRCPNRQTVRASQGSRCDFFSPGSVQRYDGAGYHRDRSKRQRLRRKHLADSFTLQTYRAAKDIDQAFRAASSKRAEALLGDAKPGD